MKLTYDVPLSKFAHIFILRPYTTVFTGPIDAYYASQGLPKLEYRSLRFFEAGWCRLIINMTNDFQTLLSISTCDGPLPNFAFNFNSRPYIEEYHEPADGQEGIPDGGFYQPCLQLNYPGPEAGGC